MVDLRELWAWFVFYVLVSVLAIIGSFLVVISQENRVDEGSDGPLEQQVYLLLIDRASLGNGVSQNKQLSQGMSEEAHVEFSQLLNEARFRENCRGGDGDQGHRVMACFFIGENVAFVDCI